MTDRVIGAMDRFIQSQQPYFNLQSKYDWCAKPPKPAPLYVIQFCISASHVPCIVGFKPANQYQPDE